MALTTVRPQGMGFVTGRRNLIKNGAMQVFQRATSATTMTNAYATVDRFTGFSNGGGAFTGEKYDMTASEIATTGHYQALKMLVSTADTSIAAADYYALAYKFEGDDLQQLKWGTSSAETLTLSFWVKSDTTGTYFLTVDKIANGLTAYRLPIEYTIDSADTWEKKTIAISPTAGSTSFITSSAGAIGGGTGHGLSLYWGFAWGTDYHGTNNTWGTGTYGTNASSNGWMGTVGNDFYITGVQLEVGTNASDFEHRSYGEELSLCQRYYFKFLEGGTKEIGVGWYYTATHLSFMFRYPTTMRATPTATDTTGTDYYIVYRNGGSDAFNSVSFENGSTEQFSAYNNTDISGTAGQAGIVRSNNASAKIEFDAEL